MGSIIRFLVNGLSIYITAYILQGVTVSDLLSALIVAFVLGLINTFIKPLILLLTIPITIMTLGLFTLVINAALIMLASSLIAGFTVANFWWALLFSLVLSIVNSILHSVVK